MKIKSFTIAFIIISFIYLNKAMTQEVNSTGGDYGTYTKGSLSYTIGETVVETLGNQKGILTQGFQQPRAKSTVSLKLSLQGFSSNSSEIMNQCMDYDISNDVFIPKFIYPIIDTVSVLIRSSISPSYKILAEYHNLNLSTDGSVPNLKVPANIFGSNYIVINHRNSTETWSDVLDFSKSIINYNFFTHPISTDFAGNMFATYKNGVYNGSLIWAGDINQDGVINIFDLTDLFDFINDPNALMGYVIEDLNCDGIVNIYDLSMVFDNVNSGASSINPFTMKKKK